MEMILTTIATFIASAIEIITCGFLCLFLGSVRCE